MSSLSPLKRFYLLDFARSIAALSVIIWHYQHFYYGTNNILLEDFTRSEQPFHSILFLFYEHGLAAVQFFFCLSGFIFFWLYLEQIRKKKINAKTFFYLRFSRLYPLHFATLLFVAFFQFIFLTINGNFIIFQINDLKHFLLNLFLISEWGLQDSFSFNAPIWSVSAEIFAYIVFFILASIGLKKFWHLFIIIGLALPLSKINFILSQVIFCFFIGGGAYFIYNYIVKKKYSLFKNNILLILLLSIITFISFLLFLNETPPLIQSIMIYGALFPTIILLLALLQNNRPQMGVKISFIGELTYSLYLLHFPLQLIIIGTAQYFTYDLPLNSRVFFLSFFAILIGLASLSYIKFEKPSQTYLRKKLIKKQA